MITTTPHRTPSSKILSLSSKTYGTDSEQSDRRTSSGRRRSVGSRRSVDSIKGHVECILLLWTWRSLVLILKKNCRLVEEDSQEVLFLARIKSALRCAHGVIDDNISRKLLNANIGPTISRPRLRFGDVIPRAGTPGHFSCCSYVPP